MDAGLSAGFDITAGPPQNLISGGEQVVSGPIEPLVGAVRRVEMTDQFAGKPIDIDPFEVIKIF